MVGAKVSVRGAVVIREMRLLAMCLAHDQTSLRSKATVMKLRTREHKEHEEEL